MHLDGNKVQGVDASTGLARPRPLDGAGHGDGRQVPEAGLAHLLPARRRRVRRGLGVGGGHGRPPLQGRQPHRLRRPQPDDDRRPHRGHHGLEPLAEKWTAFGWQVREIDGHDFAQIGDAIEGAQATQGAPTVIICDTVKGKGVDFMEAEVQVALRVDRLGARRQGQGVDHGQPAAPGPPREVRHDRGHRHHLERLRRQHADAGRDLRARALRPGRGRPAHRGAHRRPGAQHQDRRLPGQVPAARVQRRHRRAEPLRRGRRHGQERPAAVRQHHGGVRQHARARAGAHRHLLPEPRRQDHRHARRRELRAGRHHAPLHRGHRHPALAGQHDA